ncbi:hypothetical protein EDD16DRAFT_1566347 [Pisolithus croceorrhizus]|nr:hypothetical protein EDD16DRAFT_1566347 [Pisolithus croceorrhizus]
MPRRDGNSDSSYDIVPVPVPPRRHPRAPTTVQAVGDDFDAVTHDADFDAGGTEMQFLDGVTEVRTVRRVGLEEDTEPRFSGVYGEWAEKYEVNYRQGPLPTDYGMYMDEVSRRLQEIAAERGSPRQSATPRFGGGPEPLTKPVMEGDRSGRVNIWREEVARNGTSAEESGESPSQVSSSAQHTCSKIRSTEARIPHPREVQNVKGTLRRSQSNASQSYRSERMYTSSELNTFHPPKHPQQQAIGAKRAKRVKSPSPTRSERIYTMAEISALTGQKNSPPRNIALGNNGTYYNRSASMVSSPRHTRAEPRMSPPVGRTRSTSTTSVEMVLASCQPSLLHIAPVLYSLGIKQREHLRALVRLREETRDREMKEEMLRKGVTMLEWAILMDKLQGF